MTDTSGLLKRLVRAVRSQVDPRLIDLFNELTAQRDLLASQCNELMIQRDLIASERDQLTSQVSTLSGAVAQNDKLSLELAKMTEELGEVSVQRNLLASQCAEMMAQRDELLSQRDRLMTDNEDLMSRVSLLSMAAAERDWLCSELAEVTAKRDLLASQYDDLISQVSALSSEALEREKLSTQLSKMSAANPKVGDLLSASARMDDIRARYLDLMESVLTGAIYEDPPFTLFGQSGFDLTIRRRGLDWPRNAFSMVGAARMRNLRVLTEKAIIANIPGDIIETGVWRGGASIMARAVLAAYGVTDRLVILADSFEGLPPPDREHYPADGGSTFHEYPELAVSIDEVRRNIEKFGLFDDQVLLLKGWFKDTMPLVPSSEIAILRLDGDMYESTLTPLNALFDKVSKNGWIIVDDYECVPACKSAVNDFLSQRRLTPEIRPIDGVGVYFQKTE